MNKINEILFILFVVTLFIRKSQADVNKTTEGLKNKTSKHPSENIDRFVQDLDDEEWHIAHLKDAEFEGRRDCMGETFADKVRRYRKTLRNDGALVMYVSAEPIPLNESDIHEDSCKIDLEDQETVKSPPTLGLASVTTPKLKVEDRQSQLDSMISPQVIVNETHSTTIANFSSLTSAMTSSMSSAKTSSTIDYGATTVSIKPKEDSDEDIISSKMHDKKSRKSEYMFSSVEYYDEIVDFDVSVCPDVVEAIELEIDQLRKYDVECEMIVEWRSLHDIG